MFHSKELKFQQNMQADLKPDGKSYGGGKY